MRLMTSWDFCSDFADEEFDEEPLEAASSLFRFSRVRFLLSKINS